jgi:hypothetical protein
MAAGLTRAQIRDTARGLAVTLTAGVFLALVDAFGTGAPLALRLAYWIGVMLLAGLWSELCMWMVRRFVGEDRPWPVRYIVTVAAIGFPVTLLVWAVTGWVFLGHAYGLRHLPGMVWQVMLITAVLVAIAMAIDRRVATTAAGESPPRFLDRLPPRLRGAAIHAVQAEDHYLRIHTDRGSDLILMRLSDAVAELEGLEGARTHRSWWVARDAVRDVKRGDGRATLTLEGGLAVPVSRRHARALRAAGWY